MIKVVIADDQKILRETLKYIIEQDGTIEVTGCAANGFEAFDLCEKTSPDVVLMDIKMPECDGIEGTRIIKDKYNFIKILVLTSFDDNENVYKALKTGADGYISKEVDPEDIILALKSIYKGVSVVQQNILNNIVSDIDHCKQTSNESIVKISLNKNTAKENLSANEKQIIKMLTEGKNYKEISESLFFSEGSVKNIIKNLLKELNLKSRTQLVAYAIENNLL
ncbi:MAG: response regulator transcription factor [Clostridia bacterium]|nr:response regulator transcription factor [Clostridia bacterium]